MNNEIPIIIIDDETEVLASEALSLEINGYSQVITCGDSRLALEILKSQPFSLVILDITMPYIDGIELLRKITESFPDITVMMLTGLNDVETAVKCLKLGAFDYILKPIDQDRFLASISRALNYKSSQAESLRLARGLLDDQLKHTEHFAHIITQEKRLMNIFKYIEAVAPTNLPILITGETGVGKELFANAIHNSSQRKGEFVCVNTAGIDDSLFSDSLFGHVSGAFTGAQKNRRGLIDRAENGTLFLDEIGDIKPESQVKLLRLLQEGTYYPLGKETEERSQCRIIAATNRSLEELEADTHFRKDLFYRLKAHHIHIPPLRERMRDVPLLTDRFITQCAQELNKSKPTPPPELAILLSNFPFPGNIRELRGMVFDAVSRHQGGMLSCATFKESIHRKSLGKLTVPKQAQNLADMGFPFPLQTAHELEMALISEALKRSEGNKTLASEMIGMARQTFRTKVQLLESQKTPD